MSLYIILSFVLFSFLSYLLFKNLGFKIIKLKPSSVIKFDIQNFDADRISLEKYFNEKIMFTENKKILNKNMMDFLIGKRTFNTHLCILDGNNLT